MYFIMHKFSFEELTGNIETNCSPHTTSPVMLLQSSPAYGHCGGEEDQVAGEDTDEEARHRAKTL